ncbi:MAG TPA: cyclic lactone autoinducer peptide [Acetivibrio sp.]|nr:cyclic lactone autoinducer peptide [Clostridium sp.]HOQ36775.1 cyclic lactone autoinducer peptide [Acetivibrio sp.]HPT90444.1 cyclic lactone autoinducer peptide [Acetivibrio sp.]HQA56542.1 cyclic lactone autoinducer peptide [Acetivibrio sp.]
MFKKVLSLVSIVLYIITTISSSCACLFFFYQPKVPKKLLNK